MTGDADDVMLLSRLFPRHCSDFGEITLHTAVRMPSVDAAFSFRERNVRRSWGSFASHTLRLLFFGDRPVSYHLDVGFISAHPIRVVSVNRTLMDDSAPTDGGYADCRKSMQSKSFRSIDCGLDGYKRLSSSREMEELWVLFPRDWRCCSL
jgi:hypothetical protein